MLVLLVLVATAQEGAGAGMAFGGAATDALFRRGVGQRPDQNHQVRGRHFFGLALLMAFMASHRPKTGGALLLEEVTKRGAIPLTQPASQPSVPITAPTSGGLLQIPATSSVPVIAPIKTTAPSTN
jgi:preprotein translocase subunit SecG